MKLRWNKPAREALADTILFIASDSYDASVKVRKRIEAKTAALLKHPAKHPPDHQKRSNDGTFRAFTSDSLRISYRVFRQSIHVIRVRHAARKPLQYKTTEARVSAGFRLS